MAGEARRRATARAPASPQTAGTCCRRQAMAAASREKSSPTTRKPRSPHHPQKKPAAAAHVEQRPARAASRAAPARRSARGRAAPAGGRLPPGGWRRSRPARTSSFRDSSGAVPRAAGCGSSRTSPHSPQRTTRELLARWCGTAGRWPWNSGASAARAAHQAGAHATSLRRSRCARIRRRTSAGESRRMRRIPRRLRSMRGARRSAARSPRSSARAMRHLPRMPGKCAVSPAPRRAAARPAATRTAKNSGLSHSRLQGNSLTASSSAVALDQLQPPRRVLAQRRAAMVPHHGLGRVDAPPAGDARAQAQLGIVAVGEEVLVEAADLVQHSLAVHGGAAVRPEHFLFAVELAAVRARRCRARGSGRRERSGGRPCRCAAGPPTPAPCWRPCRRPAAANRRARAPPASPARLRHRC